MNRWTVLFVALLAFVAMSCSGGGDNPVAPADLDMAGPTGQAVQSQNHLWGYYDCYVDLDSQTVVANLNRSVMFAANVVTFVNGNPANLQFQIISTPIEPTHIDVDINVGITHPFPGMSEYDGYDVRGIFIGDGSGGLAYNSDLDCPELGTDQIIVGSEGPGGTDGAPDGYTRWWNPSEFTAPGVLGYTPGAFATPGYTGNATLNGYKYFANGLGMTSDVFEYMLANTGDFGVFTAGSTNRRNYYLRFPNAKGVTFNYAICANWEDETIHPSNAPEAPACRVVIDPNVYWTDGTDNGGKLKLDISPWNWQPHIQPDAIYVESNVLTAMHTLDPAEMTPIAGDPNWSTYHTEIDADNVTGVEGNNFWVICEYANLDYTNDLGVPNTANTDTLAAFFRHDFYVAPESYNQPPVCDLVIVTAMPQAEWNEVPVECDATASTDPDLPEDALTFEWDFNGNDVYGEDPEDLYTGDPDNPTHTYTESYAGVINLKVVDLALEESICTSDPLDVTVKACETLDLPLTGARWSGGSTNTIYAYYGGCVTNGTNQRFVGRAYPSSIDHMLGAMDISGAWQAYNCVLGNATSGINRVDGSLGYECDSDNKVVYGLYDYTYGSYYQRYRYGHMDWNETTNTWGAYGDYYNDVALPLTGTYRAYRSGMDDLGNMILYAYDYYSSSSKMIFHWNGTSWDTTDVSGITESYSYCMDVGWNPAEEQYYILCYQYMYPPPTYRYEPKIYVYNRDDDTQEQVLTDIFDFHPTGYWRAGIWVDRDEPDCNILVWGGSTYNSAGIPLVRYNGIMDDNNEGALVLGFNYPSYYLMNGYYSSEMDRIYTGQQTYSAVYFDMPADWGT